MPRTKKMKVSLTRKELDVDYSDVNKTEFLRPRPKYQDQDQGQNYN